MGSRRERRRAKKRNDRLRDEAWEAVARQRLDLALRTIERALEGAPGNAGYWHDKGRIHGLRGEPRAARAAFERALALAPDYAAAREALGSPEDAGERAAAPPERPEDPGEVAPRAAAGRAARYDPDALAGALARTGLARLEGLCAPGERRALLQLAEDAGAIEHELVLEGGAPALGLRAPLPPLVAELRRELYTCAARAANLREELLGRARRFPARLEEPRAGEGASGCYLLVQRRGGPLLPPRPSADPAGFPFELAIALDGAGGRLVLTDLRPGKRRARELAIAAGDGALLARTHRTVRVGGVFGLQPVALELDALEAGERHLLWIAFDPA